jgi:alanyl-tRNA synthetase
VSDAKALPGLADRLRGRLAGDSVLVLGAAIDGRVSLLVSVAPALVARGLKAGEIVRLAAKVVGGGGGGRDTMAQAGGRDPEKLDQALHMARDAVQTALASAAPAAS